MSEAPRERGGVALRAVSGAELEPWLGELARLRIRVFRDWPYLYDGDAAYEERYLRTYVESPGGVLRPGDHPRRPPGHVPLDGFWRRRGFTPLPGAVASFSWKDLDVSAESEKALAFWIKAL